MDEDLSAEVSKRAKLEASLTKFAGVGDVEGVAIVSRDGLLVASRLPRNMDQGVFCSMSAAMHAAGETVLKELKLGICQTVAAESDQGTMLAYSLDSHRLLVAVFNSKANLGLIRGEMSRTAVELRKLL